MKHTYIKNFTYMLCPYCQKTFTITDIQITNNSRFKCPHCKKYNEGSAAATIEGVLIGIRKEDFIEEVANDYIKTENKEAGM